MTHFSPPDFTKPAFASAPDARFVPAPADGVLPEGFFSSTHLPTYVRVGGAWRLPREPRMDSVLLLDADGVLWVREGRRVRKDDRVAVGTHEDGREGIYVHATAFTGEPTGDGGEFKFMTSEVSREKVAFLRYVLEAHEGVGLMHGDGSGVIRLLAPESPLAELDVLIADLLQDGTVDALLPSAPVVG